MKKIYLPILIAALGFGYLSAQSTDESIGSLNSSDDAEYAKLYKSSANEVLDVVAKDIKVYLNAEGNAVIHPEDVDNSNINSDIVYSMSVFPSEFSASDIGEKLVNLKVKDINGNQQYSTSTVTVIDNLEPNVVTKNIRVQLNDEGVASIDASQIDNGSSDNCTIADMSLSKNTFGLGDIGSNLISLIVTDEYGNTGEAMAVVIVTNQNA
ncbi:MAG: hypothetical protein ABFR62_13655, partial [Bacteroidota bacterium]